MLAVALVSVQRNGCKLNCPELERGSGLHEIRAANNLPINLKCSRETPSRNLTVKLSLLSCLTLSTTLSGVPLQAPASRQLQPQPAGEDCRAGQNWSSLCGTRYWEAPCKYSCQLPLRSGPSFSLVPAAAAPQFHNQSRRQSRPAHRDRRHRTRSALPVWPGWCSPRWCSTSPSSARTS